MALEDDGRREAAQIGERIRAHRFARVLTSPSARAAETCALAGFRAGAEICEDLREWDYGAYEGRTTAEIRAERPGWTLWGDGVPGGETLGDLARRADRVVALARSAPGDTLAFAHGHILRVVCARWLGLVAREAERFVLQPAGLGVLGWEREHAALVHWNDTLRGPLG